MQEKIRSKIMWVGKLLSILGFSLFVVSTVWAAFYPGLDSTDGSIADWTGVLPNPYQTDPAESPHPVRNSLDILNAWVASTGPSTSDYIFFRVELEGQPLTSGNTDEVGVIIDCNGNSAYNDATDVMLIYNYVADQVYRSDPSTGYFYTYTPATDAVGTTSDGQLIQSVPYGVEWRVLRSYLSTPCPNALSGNVSFQFMGQDGINGNNNEDVVPGGLWNGPTAVTLQQTNSSLATSGILVGLVAILLLGMFTWFQVKKSRMTNG